MIHSDFSSDLDVGRRPELKSDEKSEGIHLVLEIILLLCSKPPKKVVQSLAARPSALVSRGSGIGLWRVGAVHCDLCVCTVYSIVYTSSRFYFYRVQCVHRE